MEEPYIRTRSYLVQFAQGYSERRDICDVDRGEELLKVDTKINKNTHIHINFNIMRNRFNFLGLCMLQRARSITNFDCDINEDLH